jgi:putative cardiolipin synthase
MANVANVQKYDLNKGAMVIMKSNSACALIVLFVLWAILIPSMVMSFDLDDAGLLIAGQSGKSGLYVLEKGEESLLGRAWLVDNAEKSIDVQYFIWSTDNVGILAAEALLRAAERGVQVRVLVDDLMIDASPESMLALATYPNIQIRIYNPVHKTGVPLPRRVFNLLTDFRNANQRMHDKTLIVDGKFVITGGRNMADEYYDYDQEYNFRDRDMLVVGGVATDIQAHFELFWASSLSKPVESLLRFESFFTNERRIQKIRAELHAYANNPDNFAPPVRKVLAELSEQIPQLIEDLEWAPAQFIHDLPGKNSGNDGLAGGGASTRALVEVVKSATKKLVIQTPYLVMPDGAMSLIKSLVERGVVVKICTNSLSSTDNLAAFSGYKKQRKELLAAGVQIFEFKPNPQIQSELIERYPELEEDAPIFAIHAKTMVVDSRTLFVGTFNLDPRSANLNTEVGVLVDNVRLARQVEESIEEDMLPENSWRVGVDKLDTGAPFLKKVRLWMWRILPIDALL